MKNFIEVYDNALTSDECKHIIDFMNVSVLTPGYVRVGNEKKVAKEIKESHEITMDVSARNTFPNEVNNLINDVLYENTKKYVETHPQLLKLNRWSMIKKYNLQKYNPNEGYHALHCEVCGLKTSNRILAWMFYLNTVKDGGTYFDNYDLTMDAVEGRLVIWPAYWTHFHKGIVSKTETKYIATGWSGFIDNV